MFSIYKCNFFNLGCTQTELAPVMLLNYTIYKEIILWSEVFANLCVTIPPRGHLGLQGTRLR